MLAIARPRYVFLDTFIPYVGFFERVLTGANRSRPTGERSRVKKILLICKIRRRTNLIRRVKIAGPGALLLVYRTSSNFFFKLAVLYYASYRLTESFLLSDGNELN